MDADLKQRWVAALRSGQYKQGTRELYNEETNSYCCLGVLAVVIKPAVQFGDKEDGVLVGGDVDNSDLVSELLPASDLSLNQRRALAEKNDDGDSFAEIADYIEGYV